MRRAREDRKLAEIQRVNKCRICNSNKDPRSVDLCTSHMLHGNLVQERRKLEEAKVAVTQGTLRVAQLERELGVVPEAG
jgi:hypothetical protein